MTKLFERWHREIIADLGETTYSHVPFFELTPFRRSGVLLDETATLPETAPPVEAPPEGKPKEKETDEKTALDEAKDNAEDRPDCGGAKPPEDGHCRECKRLRKLNRLKLCYPCFVELVLMDEAKKRGFEWKPGDKHPDWCGCEGLGEHAERDRGAWRGN